MKIADMKVTELINEVGAGTPAPGGGAVAGLAGGVGVALTMMVNGLTLDRRALKTTASAFWTPLPRAMSSRSASST